jgi:hypothetical protein
MATTKARMIVSAFARLLVRLLHKSPKPSNAATFDGLPGWLILLEFRA